MFARLFFKLAISSILLPVIAISKLEGKYLPEWDSLDTRPLPQWYDDAKFGIFVHWGVYSVPSFGSEWFWINWKGAKDPKYIEFMQNNYSPGFEYAEFAPMFKAEFFDPLEWAKIFQSSGAKYVVLTSKHHEGFTLWPSKRSWNWNAMDVGPKRDLVGDLASALRNSTELKFGLYYSLFEWFNPLYLKDKSNNWKTQKYVEYKCMPELYDIVEKYKPSVIWSDGDWEPQSEYWNATNFIAWLYNDSPVKDEVVTNDRWGSGTLCKHGDIFTCSDRFNPGKLQSHKWENCFTIDRHSWGFRRNAKLSDFYTTAQLLSEMVITVSCGGNFLLNVGPTSYGQIAPIFEERLRQIGEWLSVNGEAIFKTRPWIYQNDTLTSDVWYTRRKMNSVVYAIVLFWPENEKLELGSPTIGKSTKVSLLGYSGKLNWTPLETGVEITFPLQSKLKTDWAWVIKFDNLAYKTTESFAIG